MSENIWDSDIKYPFEFGGFLIYKDYGICQKCNKRLDGGGIILWSSHWAECAGKQQMENIMKIKDMPLDIKDKMDLVKKEFNIES